MAEDLRDGEFWLPSEFLTDDILMEKESEPRFHNESKVCFPHNFPHGFDSSESTLSSPMGSTETLSDEEDPMAGLSLHMSQSLLFGDDKLSTAFWNENPKTTKVVAGSPQSTLCEVGSWSGCSNGSSRASSNGPSQVSSPPTTPMDQKDDAWDLLYAAAGQVMRMKMNEQGLKSHGQGLLGQPRKPVPVPVSSHMKTPNSGYYSDDAFTHFQLQHDQFQMLKRQQFMRQQLQNRSRASGFGHGRCGRSSSSFCANPPHHHHQQQQQQGGSGMRAIFLEGSGSKRESVGTGVFLPRRVGSSTELRRKPACSTVLVPARVVQALNLNLDEMGSAQPRFQGASMTPRSNSNALLSQQMLCIEPHRPSTATNYEVRLPQEWTY
ncbi:hypothetical protein AAC387_Pa05g3856 [Persea americana]